MNRGAPDWVRDTLEESHGPCWIADALVASVELAPLWDKLPEASRPNVSVLLDFMAFLLPTKGGRPQQGVTALPWSAAKPPAEQAAAARRVARAAAELNAALRDFAPLADMAVHQLFPQENHELHMMLAGLPVAGHGDCLLSRLGKMAGRFQPQRSSLVGRPGRQAAAQTALIRQCADLARLFAPWSRQEDFNAFVAGLCGVMGHTTDPDRVKASLRELNRPPRQRKRKNRS